MKNRWVNQNGDRWVWKWWRGERGHSWELRLLRKWLKKTDPVQEQDLSLTRLREQRAKIMAELAKL